MNEVSDKIVPDVAAWLRSPNKDGRDNNKSVGKNKTRRNTKPTGATA